VYCCANKAGMKLKTITAMSVFFMFLINYFIKN
jgi:hypothetical protein